MTEATAKLVMELATPTLTDKGISVTDPNRPLVRQYLMFAGYTKQEINVLRRYFPTDTRIPFEIHEFEHLLKDILVSHETLHLEETQVVQVYSVVGGLSWVANIILLAFMSRIPHKSSSALFLTFLAFIDLFNAGLLILELYFFSRKQTPLLEPHDLFERQHAQFVRLFIQFVAVFIFFLVAADRWRVHNTSKGRLFKKCRLLKFLISLTVPVAISVLVTVSLPQTIQVQFASDEEITIFTCIHMGCRGSVLLGHPWRLKDDDRATMSKYVVYAGFILITAVLFPLYMCIWAAASSQVRQEKQNEEERDERIRHGGEVLYFDTTGHHVFRKKRRLPVIYEVREDPEFEKRKILFPHSLNILHGKISLCNFSEADTIWYDPLVQPENAPSHERIVVSPSYDTDVDKMSRKFAKKPRSPLNTGRAHKDSAEFKRLIASSLPRRKSLVGSRNRNWNAPMTKLSLADKMTQTEQDQYIINSEQPGHICQGCIQRNRILEAKTNFFARQIVFSINCCCNRTAPIECVNEITFPNIEEQNHVIYDHAGSRSSSSCRHGKFTPSDSVRVNTFTPFVFHETDLPTMATKSASIEAMSAPHHTNVTLAKPSQRPRLQRSKLQSERTHSQVVQGRPVPCWWESNQFPINPASAGDCQTKVTHITETSETVEFTCETGPSRLPSQADPPHRQCQMCQRAMEPAQTCSSFGVDSPSGTGANENWNSPAPRGGRQGSNVSVGGKASLTMLRGTISNASKGSTSSMTSSPKTGLLGSRGRDQPTRRGSESVTLADPNYDKSMQIYQKIKEHFIEHSYPLSIVGLPESLSIKGGILAAERAHTINIRLFTTTVVYLTLIFLPWMAEIGVITYSTLDYMSSHFSGLVQVVCLLALSESFRKKCWNQFCCCCSCRKQNKDSDNEAEI